MEDFFFGKGGAAEEGKGAGGVASCCPAGAAVEAHAFVADYAAYASAAEGFGVGLSFYFENVEGEEDDFANADYTMGWKLVSTVFGHCDTGV